MSDHYSSLVVTFSEPIKDEHLERWRDAFLLMEDVISVEPFAINDLEFSAAKQQALHELRDQIKRILWPGLFK